MDALETQKRQYQYLKREYEKDCLSKNIKKQIETKIRLENIEENIKFVEGKKEIVLPKIDRDFSLLSHLDKRSIIEEIISAKTPYRNILNISSKIGFGIELEVTNIFLNELQNLIKEGKKRKTLKLPYDVQKEDTVCYVAFKEERKYQGGEITSRILYNTEKTWKDLKRLFTILKENHLIISEDCSMHIHVGSEIIDYNEKDLKKIIKLFVIYEHVLFRFFLGDYFQVRNIAFASPIRKTLLDKIEEIDNMSLKDLQEKIPRIVAFNIRNFDPGEYYQKNTIEMRMGNGTLNELIAQNFIMTTLHFLESVEKKGRLDFFLEDKLKKIKENSYYYTDVYLEDAFEFCDFVFEKNEDKIYFLKQYLHKLEFAKKSKFPSPISGQPKEMMLK